MQFVYGYLGHMTKCIFLMIWTVVDSVSKQTRHKPGNLNAMLDIAQKMSHATSKKFTYGIAYHLNDYTADGTIFDYMAGVRKVKWPRL